MQLIQTLVQSLLIILILILALTPTPTLIQLLLTFVQLELPGMMLQINVFTAHFLTLLSQETIKINGNAIVMPHIQ
jgi:hypothetical protein